VQTSMDQLFLAVGRVRYAWNNVLISFKGGVKLSVCELECGFDFSKKNKIDIDPDDIQYVNARLTLHFNGPSP